jgi:putative oxidoreductase
VKRVALGALALTIALQAAWMAVSHYRHQAGIADLWYPLIMTVGFAALAITRGRVRWIATALRILIGIAFASAVADRLGLMGGPGSPAVAWGTFPRFVTYTGQVNSFLPAAIIPSLAVVETVIECALGVAMLIGWQIRVAVWASTTLLFAFATAMTVSFGFASQFSYAVLVMAVGAWVLALSDSALFSVDSVFERLSRRKNVRAESLDPANP